MAGQFEDKVVLVTGGGSGIGRASALAFANQGAKVIIADLNVQGGEETVRLVVEGGGEALSIGVDVSEDAEVEALVAKTVEAYGRLDCAVNNAGVDPVMVQLIKHREEDWDRTININLKGVWLCMKYEIPKMLEQGSGAIVNVASAAGLVGVRGCSAYVASEHGVVGLTKTAALEYAKMGIRVNAVCPGNIETPMLERIIDRGPENEKLMLTMQPQGRLGKADEIAAAAVWLCSEEASFVTGHVMAVDGGLVAQ